MRNQKLQIYTIELRPHSILTDAVMRRHPGFWTRLYNQAPIKQTPWKHWVSGIPGYDGSFHA